MGMGVVMLALPYLFTNFVSVVVLAIVAFMTLYLHQTNKIKKELGISSIWSREKILW